MLYRKYRSQNFAELHGQTHVKKVLTQAIIDGKVAHAYLFTGPRGTGKTSTARILSKAINCIQMKNGEPCNYCSSCRAINEGRFLDLIEIDAASNRGIDEIRSLKEKVNFLPAEGKFKIYIIDEVHMLTSEAFNALLKTLEEPPARVVFILATTEAHKLPLTIISRTQRFDFRLASGTELKSKLERILKAEGIKFEPAALELIVEAGQGSFRDAETVLDKVLSSVGYKQDEEINIQDVEQAIGLASQVTIKQLYQALLDKNTQAAFSVINNAYSSGSNPLQLIKQLLEHARKMLNLTIEGKEKQVSLRDLFVIIKELNEAANQQKFALLSQLPLEVAVIKIIGLDEQSTSVPKKTDIPQISSKPIKEREAVKKADQAAQRVTNVTLDELKAVWGKILSKAKKYNHHMVAFLGKAKVRNLVQNTLELEVAYPLHKKTLELKRSRDAFAQITKELLGEEIQLTCEINKNMAKADITEDSSNSNLVEEVFSDII